MFCFSHKRILSQERHSRCKNLSPHTPSPLAEAHSYSDPSQGSRPFHIWSDHSMSVSDISSNGGSHDNLRIFTCSLDASCKVCKIVYKSHK